MLDSVLASRNKSGTGSGRGDKVYCDYEGKRGIVESDNAFAVMPASVPASVILYKQQTPTQGRGDN